MNRLEALERELKEGAPPYTAAFLQWWEKSGKALCDEVGEANVEGAKRLAWWSWCAANRTEADPKPRGV